MNHRNMLPVEDMKNNTHPALKETHGQTTG